jgi:hypothetical protein
MQTNVQERRAGLVAQGRQRAVAMLAAAGGLGCHGEGRGAPVAGPKKAVMTAPETRYSGADRSRADEGQDRPIRRHG